MASKYHDPTATMQVIGCVFNNPQLLDITDKYSIIDEDFADSFHKVVFGAIYKLHELGANQVSLTNIADFLADKKDGVYLSTACPSFVEYINKYQPEYVVILSGDHIYRMDYEEMLDFHTPQEEQRKHQKPHAHRHRHIRLQND